MTKKRELRFFRYFTVCDFAAAAAFVCLFLCLIYIVGRGLCPIDESFYYTIVHRQMLGDRLFVEEWHVSQLSSLLQYLPFFLYTKITGSTQGVILFARYLYLLIDGLLYWFLYARLRRYGGAVIAALCIFCSCAPLMILTLNYYTMSLQGTIVVSALLLTGKEKKAVAVLIFAGVVFACAVLAEPLLAVAYFLWCAAVLLRWAERKKEKQRLTAWDFCLNGRSWLWVTVGITAVFLCFCVFLLVRNTPAEIIASIPELFTDSEYQVGVGQSSLVDTAKLRAAVGYFGTVPPAGELLLAALLVFLKKKGLLPKWKRLLFVACCVFFAAGFVFPLVYMVRGGYGVIAFYSYFQFAPILPFGLNCYLLWTGRDRRIFGFWIVAAVYSVLIDVSSDLVFGLGGAIGGVEMLVAFCGVVKELRAEASVARNEEKKTAAARVQAGLRRVIAPLSAVILLTIVCWNGLNLYFLAFTPAIETLFNPTEEQSIDALLTKGPLKGIRTTERHKRIYDLILKDLDEIRTLSDGPLYVTERCSYYYLYAELPYACYSTWYVEADSETRVLRYWELHPEKAPAVIYIPYYDAYTYSENGNPENGGENLIEKKLAFVNRHFQCEIHEGGAGYIVQASGFHL